MASQNALRNYWFLAGLLLVNFVLKLFFLDSQSIAGDEPYSIYHAQMSLPAIISQLSNGNNPPLFEILLHYWIKLFGISTFSVRFLPLLFSVATVFFIYKIGLRFFNLQVALVASLIFTFSSYHIFFSHEARVYSLVALLATTSMYCFMGLLQNPKSLAFFVGIVLSNILLGYAHYLSLFMLLVQFSCCILFAEIRKPLVKKYTLATLLFCLGYLPFIPVLFRQFSGAASQGTWVSPTSFDDLYIMLVRYSNAPVITVGFIVLFALALFLYYKNNFAPVTAVNKVVFTWLFLPFFAMFFVSLKYLPHNIPMFMDRYVIFISIGFYLALAISAQYVFHKLKFGKWIMALPVIAMLVTCKADPWNRRDAEVAINKLRSLKTHNTLVYYAPYYFAFNLAYYFNKDYFEDYNEKDIYLNINKHFATENVYGIKDQNEVDTALLYKVPKVIYFDAAADFSFPGNNILNKLFLHLKLREKYEVPEVFRIYVFEKQP